MLRAIAEERGRVGLRREVCGLGESGAGRGRGRSRGGAGVSARVSVL